VQCMMHATCWMLCLDGDMELAVCHGAWKGVLVAFMVAAQLSEILAVETGEGGVAGVVKISFAGPEGGI
jgi:hypothetical protein